MALVTQWRRLLFWGVLGRRLCSRERLHLQAPSCQQPKDSLPSARGEGRPEARTSERALQSSQKQRAIDPELPAQNQLLQQPHRYLQQKVNEGRALIPSLPKSLWLPALPWVDRQLLYSAREGGLPGARTRAPPAHWRLLEQWLHGQLLLRMQRNQSSPGLRNRRRHPARRRAPVQRYLSRQGVRSTQRRQGKQEGAPELWNQRLPLRR